MSDYRRAHVPGGGCFILVTHQRAEQGNVERLCALAMSALSGIAAIVGRSADVAYGSEAVGLAGEAPRPHRKPKQSPSFRRRWAAVGQ